MKKLHLCAVITFYLLVAGCSTAPQVVEKTTAKSDSEVTETAELPATPFAIDTLLLHLLSMMYISCSYTP